MGDENPGIFYRIMDRLWYHGLGGRDCQKYAEELGLRGGETVLDFGGASGVLGKELSRCAGFSGRVVVMEQSDGMFEIARSRLSGMKNVECVKGTYTDLPEEPVYDMIVANFVLHQFSADEIPEILKRFKKALRSEGHVCIREPYKGAIGIDPHRLEEEGREAGLKLIGLNRNPGVLRSVFQAVFDCG